jgi:transcriptional regulator with XRE-family HTH domain
MPAISPALTQQCAAALADVGAAVRARRKALRTSAVATAEAAGISRVTLHRIEKGEPSVTAGAYMAALAALALDVHLQPREAILEQHLPDRRGWIPARVRLADYPQLRELAWQVHGSPELTPREALDIYERNWRHIDIAKLSEEEKDLVDALRQAMGKDAGV